MTKSKRTRVMIVCILIGLTLTFIWGNSLISRFDSARESSLIVQVVADIANDIFGVQLDTTDDHAVRKLAHFAEYGILGTELSMLYILLDKMTRSTVSDIMFAGLFCACVDEYLQVLSDRGSLLSDVFLDFSGVISGVMLVIIIHSFRENRCQSS